MASELLWPTQLQWCRRAPDQGWETWCLHDVTKQDYLTPVAEGTEDSTDSPCQAWPEQLLSKKGTQSPVCPPFQRSALPQWRQVSRARYDRPSTRERFQMLLLAALCVKKLSCCAKRESMLLAGSTAHQGRLRWEPGTAGSGRNQGNLHNHR